MASSSKNVSTSATAKSATLVSAGNQLGRPLKRRLFNYVPMRAPEKTNSANQTTITLNEKKISDENKTAKKTVAELRATLPLKVQMFMSTGPGFMTPGFYPYRHDMSFEASSQEKSDSVSDEDEDVPASS